jgi:hypothetical protein
MLQPSSGGVGEEQGEVASDEVVIVRSTQLAGQPVVREPQFWPCFPRVLGDGSRGSEPGQERRLSYGPAESLRTRWFGRGTPILPAVVASPKWFGRDCKVVRCTLSSRWARRSRRWCSLPRRPGAADVASRVRPVWTDASRMNREVATRCSGGVPLPLGGRSFGPLDRGILQEILEFSLDTPPHGGGWLRRRSE